MSTPPPLDLDKVILLADDLLDRAESLHQATVPAGLNGRDRSARQAQLSKDLLFLSHLCESTRVAVMDQYHALRGYTTTP